MAVDSGTLWLSDPVYGLTSDEKARDRGRSIRPAESALDEVLNDRGPTRLALEETMTTPG
jgi:hypothetical protein